MTIRLQPPVQFDLVGATQFQQDIERRVASNPKVSPLWIVELSKVKRMGHAGLRLLLSLRRLAEKRRCRLVLENPSATVRHTLDAAMLDDYFEIDRALQESDDDLELELAEASTDRDGEGDRWHAEPDTEVASVVESASNGVPTARHLVASIRAKLAEVR